MRTWKKIRMLFILLAKSGQWRYFPKGHPNKSGLILWSVIVRHYSAMIRVMVQLQIRQCSNLQGFTKDTPQPAYGYIEKDPQTGEPTGYLAETAQQAVFSKIPMYPDEVWERAMKRAMDNLTAWGVTAYIDASANEPQFRVYQKMEREGNLNFHISGSIP